MKKLSLIIAFALPFLLFGQQATSLRRVAFVVGNANYEEGKLFNPVNDARDVANELKKLGFEVFKFENLSRNDFRQAIDKYGDELRKDPSNTVGLFYYSGHGLQYNAQNYLIPIDAQMKKEADIDIWSVNLNQLMRNLHAAEAKMNVVIIDACRAIPFFDEFESNQNTPQSNSEKPAGLAPIDAPVGTFIAFATSPGNVAADGNGLNGLYTQELIKAMQIPDLPIEQVFKKVRIEVKKLSEGEQIPWENSSLESEFYFRRSKEYVAEGVVTDVSANTLPIPERYARDVCGCLSGLTKIMEKIEEMPRNTPKEKLNRLQYEAEVAIEQGDNCVKNIFRNYPSIPTKDEEAEAKRILEGLCPSVYKIFMGKK
jgi:Caspase domain